MRSTFLSVLGLTSFAVAQPVDPGTVSKAPLVVKEEAGRLLIAQGGVPVGEFLFADAKIKRPAFANLRVPGGIQVTRNFPPVEGRDATDHADMHPGLWLGFGDINGQDFWRNGGVMRHEEFTVAPVWQDGLLRFATKSMLLTKEGAAMGRMDATFTLKPGNDVLALTWEAAFHATEGNLIFGDQEEMGFGVRVATGITEKNGGVITSSEGLTGAKETWGRPATWCDYSGVIEGQKVGITIVPDPANPQPCWWHNRDYGVFVANAFGRNAMKQGKMQSVTVKQGGTLRLGFTALLHSGKHALPGW